MLFGYLTLFTALIISLSAAVYSILGLTAIFAAAFWPIVVLGGSLEFGKIVTTLWLHKYWDRAEIQYKLYLCSAVAILMLLTSMGVFGFLSKAHSDQSLVSGDVGAKIAIYDEKIKISRENIDANRKALKQMDEAVDQVMGRSTDEKGADKAVAIRRGQAAERKRLLSEIEADQKKITALNEERAPIAAENRKVEAEVGPIKYIAALIYGDNPEANVLEKSVRWVIILIVIVFDPLALTLLLAATKTLEWERSINLLAIKRKEPEYEPDDGPLTDEQVEQLRKIAQDELPTGKIITKESLFAEPESDEELPTAKKRFAGFSFPMSSLFSKPKEESVAEPDPLSHVEVPQIDPEDQLHILAKQSFLAQQPDVDERIFHAQHQEGQIDRLPWHDEEHINSLPISDGERKQLIERFVTGSTPTDTDQFGLEADNVDNKTTGEVRGFGTQFPTNANKGDMFLRVDRLPSTLYKFNGNIWIEVDKTLSDQYAYDNAYIDHLIEKIDTGEYDPDLLSDAERDSIETRLRNI
jgi:hypothetical protein